MKNEPAARAAAREIGETIRRAVPADHVFVLILAGSAVGSASHYISNGQRPDVVRILRELATILEAGT